LVELHGGTVNAASEGEGRGSMFTVSLPTVALRQPRGDGPREHPTGSLGNGMPRDYPDLSGVRVLVVDDESDARDLITLVLNECRADVVPAGSADEALAKIGGSSFDVIVSDVGMPSRDGYDFMRELRRRGNRTPAAALTAFASTEDRTRALRAGYQTHIGKPVEPAELLAAVAALVHKPIAAPSRDDA
jgi:CheY-like chemotaxis protein